MSDWIVVSAYMVLCIFGPYIAATLIQLWFWDRASGHNSKIFRRCACLMGVHLGSHWAGHTEYFEVEVWECDSCGGRHRACKARYEAGYVAAIYEDGEEYHYQGENGSGDAGILKVPFFSRHVLRRIGVNG